MRIRNLFDDLLWRVMRPTLAYVWDECVADLVDWRYIDEFDAGEARARNPYRGDDR